MDRFTDADVPWEEALDLDDEEESPLRPLKRLNTQTYIPVLRSCSSSRTTQTPPPNPTPARLIPGPAGVVQAAMLRHKNHVNKELVGFAQEDPVPTQEYIRRAVEGGSAAEDHDFSNNPWLDAVDFVRREGLVIDSDGAIGIPLRAIKSGFNDEKVPQVVAIIESCSPNGFGDMMVTLKDPTGTIGASIHRKALTEGDFGKDISVGAVIIIQKVAVFSTSHVKHYLNITLRNVVKVFSRDGTAPVEQNCSASVVKLISPKTNEMSWMPSSLAQEKAGDIMNNLRQNPDILGSAHSDHMEKEIAMTNNSTDSEWSNQKQSTGVEEECMSGRQDVGIGGEVYGGTSTSNHDRAVTFEMLDPWKDLDQASKEKNTQEVAQDCGPASKLARTYNDGMQKIHQPTSKTSLPQWTDEQLDELFAFD